MRDLSVALETNAYRKIKSSTSNYRLNIAILASIVIIGLTYLFLVTGLGTKGYEIRKLEQQLRSVEDQQKTLQLRVSDLKSINRIREEANTLNFVPATNITYLKDYDYALR